MTTAPLGPDRPTRVAVVQPSLAAYRVPVYRELARRPNVDLHVYYGTTPGMTNAAPDGFDAAPAPLKRVRVAGHPLNWHAAHLTASRGADVMFVTWDVHYAPSLLPGLALARRRGCGTVLWGHGYGGGEGPGRRRLRNALGRRADVLQVYGERPRQWLIDDGFDPGRVVAAPNTVDASPMRDAAERLRNDPARLDAARRELKLDRPTLLHVARHRADRRVDLLIEAAATLTPTFPTLRLALIGRGQDDADLMALADRLGVRDRVSTPGPVYDEDALAPYYLLSRALVFPDKIGLSLHHALAYGLPVVTHGDARHHAPEFEALDEDVNGLTFARGDVGDLARVLGRLLGDDALRHRLGEGARRTMAERFSLSNMVDGFVASVRAADRVRRP